MPGKKNKTGRPPLGQARRSNESSVVAAVRLLGPDRAKLQRLADENERSLSAQIRLMVKRQMQHEQEA